MSDPDVRELTLKECSERLQRLEVRHVMLADRFELHARHAGRQRAQRGISWWASTSSYDRLMYAMVAVMLGTFVLNVVKTFRGEPLLEEGV